MSIHTSRTIAGLILVAIVIAIFWYMKKDTSTIQVASFTECVRAGYQVSTTSFPATCSTPEGVMFTDSSATSTATATATTSNSVSSSHPENSDRIRVTNISAGERVTSPLTVEGQARGGWYFEASFPVELRDGNGKLIAQMPAQALGEWMTPEFVPFKAVLTFAKPTTSTGTLILHNDNPSGLPENDRWISVPVRF